MRGILFALAFAHLAVTSERAFGTMEGYRVDPRSVNCRVRGRNS